MPIGFSTKTVKRITHVAIIATVLFCLALLCGCASSSTESEPKDSSSGVGSAVGIEELPAQGEFAPTDPANRRKVHVQVPEGYEYSEYLEDVEPYTGKAIELEALLVDLGEQGSLRIIVDDVGFFDWWYSGSMYGTATAAEYVDAAKEERFNSSWQANVGGHDATVLVQGSAAEGGETSGDAYVFLDGATVVLSAVPPDGETPAADAYTDFFRSKEVSDLLGRLAISLG